MSLNWILEKQSQYASKIMRASKMKITSKGRQPQNKHDFLNEYDLKLKTTKKNDRNLKKEDNLIKWKQRKNRGKPQKRGQSENKDNIVL